LADVRFCSHTGLKSDIAACPFCADAVEKVENGTTPKIAQMLIFDYSVVAMLFSVDTKVRGRFSEKRCGPSRRYAGNASAALNNFAYYLCVPKI